MQRDYFDDGRAGGQIVVDLLQGFFASDQLHLPDTESFRQSTTSWNSAIRRDPALVVQPGSLEQLQRTVVAARSAAVPLSVRGGGQDWAGRSATDGGVVVDLSRMRHVDIDADAGVGTIGGGATAADVVAAAEPDVMAPVTGWSGSTGLAGLTLLGGYGPLLGAAGLASDNLISALVIGPDAEVRVTDAERDADLFWALRGGGGNFGIVVAMRVRLHRVAEVTAGLIRYPWTQAAQVLLELSEVLPQMPAALTVRIGIFRDASGTSWVHLYPAWSHTDDPTRWLDRLANLGTPARIELAPMRQSVLLARRHPYAVSGRRYEIRSRRLLALTPQVIEALVRADVDRAMTRGAVVLEHFHGSAAAIPAVDSAFGLRIPHLKAEIVASWRTGQDPVPHQNWARRLYDELGLIALPGGDPALIAPGRTREAELSYGPNAARLCTVKNRYDPHGVFTATTLPTL